MVHLAADQVCFNSCTSSCGEAGRFAGGSWQRQMGFLLTSIVSKKKTAKRLGQLDDFLVLFLKPIIDIVS
jgi:hypothetical protein